MLVAVLGGGGLGPVGDPAQPDWSGPTLRQRAFGFNFMLVNLGIGFGGLVSASIVDLHRPETFTVLYILDSLVAVVSAVVIIPLWKHGQPVTEHHDDPVRAPRAGARSCTTDAS